MRLAPNRGNHNTDIFVTGNRKTSFKVCDERRAVEDAEIAAIN
jgi:hypothetical protein